MSADISMSPKARLPTPSKLSLLALLLEPRSKIWPLVGVKLWTSLPVELGRAVRESRLRVPSWEPESESKT